MEYIRIEYIYSTLVLFEGRDNEKKGNYCVLLEYHKCVLLPLILMVGPTN